MNDMSAPSTAPGSIATPDTVAELPSVPWMNSGMMTPVPISAAWTMTITTTAVA